MKEKSDHNALPPDAEVLVDLRDNRPVRIVVSYRGQIVGISRARLAELLETEERYLRSASSGVLGVQNSIETSSVRREKEPATLAGDWSELDAVTHSVLSLRIKKIHSYCAKAKVLRPNALTLLRDVMAKFDWRIPLHPNTQLDHFLREIASWKSTSQELRDEIEAFLARYLAARVERAG